MISKVYCLFVVILISADIICCSNLVVKSAIPLDSFNELFVRDHGWIGISDCYLNVFIDTTTIYQFIGADGTYSCKISETMSIWHFADTFIGDRIENKRTNWTMIRNSLAIQRGIM